MPIGSYDKPTKSSKAPPTPAKNLTTGIQEDLKQDVEYQSEAAERAKTYEEILEEAEISLNQAHTIVDDMLTKGFHETTMEVTKTSTVTFRTRTHADYQRYLKALEVVNPKYVDEQNDLQLRYFLAASLVRFKDKEFAKFDDAFDWIAKQPERLIILLANKLAKFDRIIAVVMSEGVVENF